MEEPLAGCDDRCDNQNFCVGQQSNRFDKTCNVIQAIGADWVFEHENGTWSHRAEPR